MQGVVVIGQRGRVSSSLPHTTKTLKGYAASRQSYDKRRRSNPLDAVGKQFKVIVQHDPCSGCGRVGKDTAADHITPLQAGGTNTWDNLTGLCRPCNASKKDKPLLIWLAERR